ncbi:BTB/POZ domain-containing protein 19 isoform X2 [Heterocephalus glaber]|uniref:BTB/POZ domain-containing protein 19 isoform X2 n=1 Tax=Heterocephalus glaber TaxID=10181 RepID=A0AAX6SBE3_HETGA|nr:BTB/POZ domain-containing protein 19 isoform X2 [Heterocephalus glaber]
METPGLVVHGQAAPFSTALRSLVNNPQYSDVCFVVGQERKEVFAHQCLLACRCNFFQRLLGSESGPEVPRPVVLSTVPAEAFLAVLEFLYTNSVKLHHHSVLEVLTAAVEYGLEELRELCLEFVEKVLDVELVCEALQVAVTFGLGPLQERCIAFIEAHSQEALQTRGFLELSAAALLPLMRSDKLCVDEAELVRAARSWARVGAAVLERPVAEVAAPVVPELRLALLAPAELSALEEQNRREPLIPVRRRRTRPSCLQRGERELEGVARLGVFGNGALQVCGDQPSLPGGADRGGVEVPRSAARGCSPGGTLPPPEGDPAPGAPPLSGPALQMTPGPVLGLSKLQLPTHSALGAGFCSWHA